MQKYAIKYAKYAEVHISHTSHIHALPTYMMTVTDGDIDGQGDLIRPTAIDRAGRRGGPRQAAAHTEPGMLQGLRGTGRRA